MANDNKLELVVEVDVNKANASIKSINAGLSGMEHAAVNSARGAAAGIDGLTVSVAKGAASAALLVAAFERVIEVVKQYTVEAALLAARNETLGVVNAQLARANGYSGDSIERLVDRIKGLGITTQASRDVVNKMIASQLDLSKAVDLARMAQDAAVVSGENSSEALQGIIHGITTQQIEVLRTYGINVQFERVFQEARIRLNRELTDSERKNLAFQRVLGEAPKLAGAYEASLETAGKQLTSLSRFTEEAKAAIGAAFLPELRKTVAALTDLAKWAKENAGSIATFAKALGAAALAAAVAKFIGWMADATGAVSGLSAAIARNPLTALAVAATFAGATLYEMYGSSKNLEEQLKKQNKESADTLNIFYQIERGRTVAQLQQMGYSVDQIRKAFLGAKQGADEFMSGYDAGEFAKRIKVFNQKELEELRKTEAIQLAHEITKRQAEAMKAGNELLLRAAEERKSAEHDVARQRIEDSQRVIESTQSETTTAKESLKIVLLSRQEYEAGIAKIREDEKREIEQHSTFVDEKGILRRFTLKPEVLELVHQATAERIAAFDLKFNQEEGRRLEQLWEALGNRVQRLVQRYMLDPVKQNLYLAQQVFELEDRREDRGLSIEKEAVQQRKDLQLAQVEAVTVYTVRDKIALEGAKTRIETEAIRQRTEIELKEIDRRTEYQIDEAEKSALAQGIFDEARIAQVTGRIRALGEMEKAALGRSSANEIEVTAIKGATAQRNTVIEYYRDIFSSLKQQAGGVFDALLTKSQSVWSAIGNSLKTAILTAIKDVVTSRVAAMLMQLFVPGANVQFRQGGLGQGGPLGRPGTVLGIGAVPVFGGATGAAGGLPNILAPVFGPGGTPPFVPATASAGAGIGAATATSGGIFSKAGWAGMLPGLKSLFGITPSIQIAEGIATTWQAATMAQKLSSIGHSTGAALAGGMLALDGLRRGGYTGLAETTAGGSIIGYKFGGPIGAAIGAAAGAVAGIVRLFVKGAVEKAKEKIKSLYGVDISDKGVLHQIVDMAKSSFGGNLDMAIRSPQIRDLIQLYAMSTGQTTAGMPGTVTPLSLVETGGSLFQSPQFQNGAPLPALGGFPSLDRIGRGTLSGGGLVIQLDGPATTALLRGEAVQAIADNPRVVQSAAMSATKSNVNRREMTSLQLSPGLLTS